MDYNLEGDHNPEDMNNSPPKIFCTLPPLLLKQNHPASIPIKVTGRPSPEVHWSIRGVPIDQCSGCRVSTGPGRRSQPDEILTVLEISSVDESLEGGVEVMAENIRGTDRFVVPLKTYRLLSGIYLEEERNRQEMEGKGFDGSRTIDRRLFHNEVDEACKGIKIYQAYNNNNISKSYDNCHNNNNNNNGDDDPAMIKWKREMAKRNMMKSIDDIVESFDENPDARSTQLRARTLGSESRGNSSFRSETMPHIPPDLIQTGSRSFSLQRGRGWVPTFKPLRVAQKVEKVTIPVEPVNGFEGAKETNSSYWSDKNALFSFYGQRLSEFCERALYNEDDACNNVHLNHKFEAHLDVKSAANDDDDERAGYASTDINNIDRCAVLDQSMDDLQIDVSSANTLDDKNENCLMPTQFCEFTKNGEIYNKGDFQAINGINNESEVTRQQLDHSVDDKLEPNYVHESFIRDQTTEIDDLEQFQREDLKSILSNLNEQLEKWKVESEREDVTLTRTNSGRFRSPHCRSENFERRSTAEFSEYSKSLNELTEKLTNFDGNKIEMTFFKPPLLPLKENLETKDIESQFPITLKKSNYEGRVGLVKPQIAKKPVPQKKPEVLPKPKFLKDHTDIHDILQARNDSTDARDNNDSPDFNSVAEILSARVEVTSSPSSDSSCSSYVFSSSSSSWGSRSFTPSPNEASNGPNVSPSSPSYPTSSPHDNSPSPSSSCLDSSFSLSPSTPSTKFHQSSTFNSTKYKLVNPPSPLILAENSSPTPLSTTSSPFLPPQPFSCPPSIEMSRKMNDIWLPGKSVKSVKILKIPRRGSKSPSLDENSSTSAMSGSVGNVNAPHEPLQPQTFRFASARSVEILPERRDSFASMEKYRSLNSSRRALSKKYELVTITTQDETVTLKNRDDDSKLKSREGKATIGSPNPTESMNAAERLYYLLGGGKQKEGGDGDKEERYPEDSKRIKIEAYKLPRDLPKGEEDVDGDGDDDDDDDEGKKIFHDDGESYEDLVSSLITLAEDQ